MRLLVPAACVLVIAAALSTGGVRPVGARSQRPPADVSREGVPRPAAPPTGMAASAFVSQYCTGCHNQRLQRGGLTLEGLDPADAGRHPETWEMVVRKLRTGMMPPEGAAKPPAAAREAFTASLEGTLDRAARERLDPGAPALHRLNRAEYTNAIRDLLALDIDAAALLPPDDAAAGFDNIADVLGVSPALIEGYAAAAAKISRLALGDRSVGIDRVVYRVPGDVSQDAHVERLPLGTRGGLVVEHTFPLDAEYELQVGQGGGARLGGGGGGPRADDLYLAIDGVQVAREGRGPTRLRLTAGPHTIAAAVVVRSRAGQADGIYDVDGRTPGVTQVSIAGPFNATGPGETPSRRRLLLCSPATAAEERPCATRILTALATRAYRRPVAASGADIDTLLAFYDEGRRTGGSFDAGIGRALARVLVDPQFLFRFEREPADVPPGRAYPISDLELASRLSFFLWSSIPDDELLEAAAGRTLSDPAVLERHVRRMLADPRADALVTNFAAQWLLVRELRNAKPDSPDFDGNLRDAFQQETELLLRAVLREDRSLLDLLDADFTFVNERLARHYGIPDVRGSRMRRIALAENDPRRGLLGHGSVLTVTSAANRTSPVLRGKWVLETLLGAPPPQPPPGVETNLEGTAEQVKATSLRQRLEQHRASPACASCHRIMDPVGFALENFDHTGKWRTHDGAVAIDASGRLSDGTALDGPAALRRVLLDKSDVFATVAAEKLLTYAVGRAMRAEDMPAVRSIARAAASNGYRFSSLVLGAVATPQFQMRTRSSREPE